MRGCPCGRGAARGPRVPGAGGAGSAGRSWGPGAPPARPGAAHSRSAFLDPGSLEAEHTHPTVPAETHCEQDLPTPAPPTAPPRPSPTPAPASPRVFRYSLNGTNGTCLLVSMGLQLNVTYRTVDNKEGWPEPCSLHWVPGQVVGGVSWGARLDPHPPGPLS